LLLKKYKSKSKRKSGIYDKPSDEVVKKQLWPQSKLQYEYAGSKMSFEDLEFNLFELLLLLLLHVLSVSVLLLLHVLSVSVLLLLHVLSVSLDSNSSIFLTLDEEIKRIKKELQEVKDQRKKLQKAKKKEKLLKELEKEKKQLKKRQRQRQR
jgi:uncharacterized membrane protein (DUF106 family)